MGLEDKEQEGEKTPGQVRVAEGGQAEEHAG